MGGQGRDRGERGAGPGRAWVRLLVACPVATLTILAGTGKAASPDSGGTAILALWLAFVLTVVLPGALIRRAEASAQAAGAGPRVARRAATLVDIALGLALVLCGLGLCFRGP